MNVLVRNGIVIDPATNRFERLDVRIEGDRIAEVAAEIAVSDDGETIDANGGWIAPGVIDLAARVPVGSSAVGESLAAGASGVTTICVPPDGPEIIDNPTQVRDLARICAESNGARVVTIGGLTVGLEGRGLTEMAALKAAGCGGVGNGRNWISDSQVMRCALRYAADLGLCVFITPRDPWLTGEGYAHAGRVATRLGMTGIPAAAETAALARDLALVEDTGVRAHFGPLSCAGAVELVRRARHAGLPVTADTAITHLFLTEMDVSGFKTACRLDPPLRTQEDRSSLRDAVAEGLLMIRSDHHPVTTDAKLAPFQAAQPGAATLPTFLHLGIKLIQEELLTPAQLFARISSQPAEVIGSKAGHIAPGGPADLVIVDSDAVWRCDPDDDNWPSAGRSTPFRGWEMPGRVIATLVGGRRVC